MKHSFLAFVVTPTLLSTFCISSIGSSAAPAKTPTKAVTQIARGHELYKYWCGTCHGSGVGAEGRAQLPGTAALQEKYQGDPAAMLEQRSDLTPDTIELFVRNGISVMPFFRKTEISDDDLAAISAYLTHSGKKAPR